MAQSREDIFKDLEEGQQIGPDHHQFQLKGEALECPLGQLWQADDVSTKTPIGVSLIMLDPFFLQNKNFLASFKKQILRAKTINHSHVADIYGYFIHKGGLLFFAFEPVDELSLESLINGPERKVLKPNQTQALLSQLTVAINACAKQWRSPFGALDSEFVFVNKKGGVKLLPISMRTFFHEAQGMPDNIYAYKKSCSPQALGHDKLDASSDSYLIACTALRLFGGNTFSQIDSPEQRDEVKIDRPADLSDTQWDCLQKALSGQNIKRFPSSGEFIKEFFAAQSEPQNGNVEALEPSDDPDSSSKTAIKFKLGKKSISFKLPKFAIPVMLFIAGIGTGFILGVFSSSGTIDKTKAELKHWSEEAVLLQKALQESEQARADAEAKAKNYKIKNQSIEQQLNSELDSENPPLSVFRDPLPNGSFGPDMVVLSAGEFIMGDSSGDGNDNEKPAHKVSFKHKFALSRYEVTFAQYDVFATQTGRTLPDDEGWGREQQPVINVTWREARAYTRWLAKETNLAYRLPTEAEWEYAARAGTTTNYWWGDKSIPGHSHCTDCGNALGGKQPLTVGSLRPNPWGLHDLNGNVDEWVMDCYTENYQNAKADGTPYQVPGCKNRSMRGGSWFDIKRITRSTSRYRHPADSKRNSWGFRVALPL
jgi:formylglycine-generating enzyme required for sulfatase activity